MYALALLYHGLDNQVYVTSHVSTDPGRKFYFFRFLVLRDVTILLVVQGIIHSTRPLIAYEQENLLQNKMISKYSVFVLKNKSVILVKNCQKHQSVPRLMCPKIHL